MTCASCSARIERKLNKLDGVRASVNLATSRASVHYAAPVRPQDLVTAVEQTGYGALGPRRRHPGCRRRGATSGHDLLADRALRQRALVSLAAHRAGAAARHGPAAAVRRLGSGPWLELVLTTPVVVWAAWPFHRAAALNARHGASTMDTLVSLGVIAAYLWSLCVCCTGTGCELGWPDAAPRIYLEVAAGGHDFLLAGRYAEARATRRAGAPRCAALLELGAKDVAVLRIDATGRATEVRVPIDDLVVGDHFVVRPGEKIATDGVVVEGQQRGRRVLVTGESMPVEVTDPATRSPVARINTPGRLVVEATRVGADTTLAAIARLVEQAQSGKAPVQRLADRVSAVFVPVVLGARAADLRSGGGSLPGTTPTPRCHGRRRRADHRLPLRPRAGHPDRAAGRHRPRRPARAC